MLLSATDESSTLELFSAVEPKSSFLGEVELRKVETSRGSWVGGRCVVVKFRFTTTVVLPGFGPCGSEVSVGSSGIQSDDLVRFRLTVVVRKVVKAGAG